MNDDVITMNDLDLLLKHHENYEESSRDLLSAVVQYLIRYVKYSGCGVPKENAMSMYEKVESIRLDGGADNHINDKEINDECNTIVDKLKEIREFKWNAFHSNGYEYDFLKSLRKYLKANKPRLSRESLSGISAMAADFLSAQVHRLAEYHRR